ncbi:uncharacterized protein [Emydura macquarii macquarii]|uniref:uncharacterized protein isoform X2 n=1 Tax=Emydura macquarii macquarii TaxID=1129001 RepID=UPI00352ABF84
MALGRWLWLCLLAPALWVASQESCQPNGSLPAPELALNVSLAHIGDTVRARCQVHNVTEATRVIFCKDGQEAASQQFTVGKFSYDFTYFLSGLGDAGYFSCRYQHKADNNEVVNSNLSTPRILNLTGAGRVQDRNDPASPGTHASPSTARNLYLILGISVACTLLLGLVGLLYRVSSSWRRTREPGPSSGGVGRGGDGHIEEQLHYAAVGPLYRPKTLPPKNDDAVTYATLR